MRNDDVLEFWNKQAALQEKSGSRDLIAKDLEVAALARHIRNGMDVCEFGCGNGTTAIYLARRFDIRMECFDFAQAMVDAARKTASEAGLGDRVRFDVADVQTEPVLHNLYDAIYTERMLINLPDWETQARAILYFARHLKPGGRLLLCENSRQGLEKVNSLRAMVELAPISPPWHNCYLDDSEVATLKGEGLEFSGMEPFSSTYYFLSRVVNAWLSGQQGLEPAYDAEINKLALSLPPFGDCAQGKLWIFDKRVDSLK